MRYTHPHGLEAACKQFLKDLRNDKDFLEFKKKSIDYGTPVVNQNKYLLNQIGGRSERMVIDYLKQA